MFTLFTVSSSKWICPRKIYLPPADLETYQYVRPIIIWKASATLSLQQSWRQIYDGTRHTEYKIHVQEGRVDKSLHQNYRKPSHVCAIMPCTECSFKARKFPSGCWHCMYDYTHYSIATQPADYNDYLISKLCVYYLEQIP